MGNPQGYKVSKNAELAGLIKKKNSPSLYMKKICNVKCENQYFIQQEALIIYFALKSCCKLMLFISKEYLKLMLDQNPGVYPCHSLGGDSMENIRICHNT
jgi:hypothetical protein